MILEKFMTIKLKKEQCWFSNFS